MKIETIATLVTCCIACGGILIYIGKSLQTLSSMKDGIDKALAELKSHDDKIEDIDKRLVKVETKQEDCGTCP